MRLITYNIRTATRDLNPCGGHFWLTRTKRQLDLLKPYEADVLCLQEATIAQLAMYALKGYRYKGKFNETITLVRGNAEIKAHKVIELHREGKYQRYCYYAQIATSGGIYNVFNVHTDWGANLYVQLQEIEALAEGMKNVIVCGDFNAEQPMLDGLKHWETKPTFCSFDKVCDSCLDHVFTNREAKVMTLQNYRDASDHLPILAEL